MSEAEGVIKYRIDHRPGPAVDPARIAELTAWRAVLHRLTLIGQRPDRYEGYGYGNVSIRFGQGFIISGTQTGAPEWLPAEGWAVVRGAEVTANSVHSAGPVRPSSEALTHAACYALDPAIGCVLHVHAPEIWGQAARAGLPSTPADVPYGTPAMAGAVAALHEREAMGDRGVLTMRGHEDGVIAFGPGPAVAGALLVEALARALAQALADPSGD